MLRPCLGCRNRREPVLRQRAPGLLGLTLADRAGKRGWVGVGSDTEEGKFSIRAGCERPRGAEEHCGAEILAGLVAST